MADPPVRPTDPECIQQLEALLVIAQAAQKWARNVSIYMPVLGRPWVYSTTAGALDIVVNGALALEQLLNPLAIDPEDPLKERLAAWRVMGPATRGRIPMVTVEGLLANYEAILGHFALHPRIVHGEDNPPWPPAPIEPVLIDNLGAAARVLEQLVQEGVAMVRQRLDGESQPAGTRTPPKGKRGRRPQNKDLVQFALRELEQDPDQTQETILEKWRKEKPEHTIFGNEHPLAAFRKALADPRNRTTGPETNRNQ